jgi:hypothetical protein
MSLNEYLNGYDDHMRFMILILFTDKQIKKFHEISLILDRLGRI